MSWPRRKRVSRSRAWRQEETQHKAYPVEEWQRAVLSGQTRLGYWNWVHDEIKVAKIKLAQGDMFVTDGKYLGSVE